MLSYLYDMIRILCSADVSVNRIVSLLYCSIVFNVYSVLCCILLCFETFCTVLQSKLCCAVCILQYLMCYTSDCIVWYVYDVTLYVWLVLYSIVWHCISDHCRDMFKCANGRCVPVTVTCNGIDNCGDNSDEIGNGCSKLHLLILPLIFQQL